MFVFFAAAFAMPVAAAAEMLTVNGTADEADLLPGTGGCVTAAGKCTLRAAIEEANTATEGGDEIVFDESVFNGHSTSTIHLGGGLPTIVKPVRINGGKCAIEAAVTGPCVAIQGTNSLDAASVSVEADEVTLEGLAVIGSALGIEFIDAHEFKLLASWFGVGLGGSMLGQLNGTAVVVGPGSGDGAVGGKQPGDGSVFVGNGVGLEIRGASHVDVLGNRFGVDPSGSVPPYVQFNEAIVVSSDPLTGDEAIGNAIGARVSPAATATQLCDGGCNLVSNVGTGVSMGGASPDRAPPTKTTVAGNYFGLTPAGNPGMYDVNAISAGGKVTTIGGPAAGDANRINGGGTAIYGGGPDLLVEGNLIGVDFDAGETLAPPGNGIQVFSEGLSNPADEAVIDGNVIGVDGGWGIDLRGLGATVLDNLIAGAEIGIITSGSTQGHGNLIEENLIDGSATDGVMIENDLNEIYGNEVLESGVDGIAIIGRRGPAGTSGNVVGGDTDASENLISLSGRRAIAIWNAEQSQNEIGRNRGFGNDEGFIAAAPIPRNTNRSRTAR